MTTSVTERRWRDANSMFAADGVPVHVIHDSPGFVVQRTVAHMISIACEIAQQRIATPEHRPRGEDRLGLSRGTAGLG